MDGGTFRVMIPTLKKISPEMEIVYNSIIFIESLESSRATTDLLLHLNNLTEDSSIGLIHKPVKTSEELLSLLSELEWRSDIFPIVHFAAHGRREGLRLKDGFVEWNKLLFHLQAINKRLGNGLLVFMASCYGAHVLDNFGGLRRAPFSFLLAPAKEIEAGTLEVLQELFYSTFIETESINAAVKSIDGASPTGKPQIENIDSIRMIYVVLRYTIDRIDDGKARHDLIKRHKEHHGVDMPYEEKYKLQDREAQIDLYDSIWHGVLREFLMLDVSGLELPPELQVLSNFRDCYSRLSKPQ